MFPNDQHRDLHKAALAAKRLIRTVYPDTLPEAADMLIRSISIQYTSGEGRLAASVAIKPYEIGGLPFSPSLYVDSQRSNYATQIRLEKMLTDAFLPLLHERVEGSKVNWLTIKGKFDGDAESTFRFYIHLTVKETFSVPTR